MFRNTFQRSIFGAMRSPSMTTIAAAGITLAAVAPQCFGSVVVPQNEYAYQIPNSTGSSQTGLTIVLSGDQTGNLTSFENTMTSGLSSASYASGSTTISYSGSAISNGGEATVGFALSGSTAPDITNAYWTGDPSAQIPLLETIGSDTGSQYAVISIDPSSMDLIFTLNSTPSWDYRWSANDGNIPLSGAEYFMSPSQIPLDQLNSADLSSEPWQPIPGLPNGTVVDNGSSLTTPLPEPTSLGLLAIGGLGLMMLRRRRGGNEKAG